VYQGEPYDRPDEPVNDLNSQDGDVGFGTSGFRVFATDEAINVIGTHGPAAFETLGPELREAAEKAEKRLIVAKIDALHDHRLRFTKKP
jgi:hypothetical protein